MRKPQRFITGTNFRVFESPNGHFKAYLNGRFGGWTSVWADSYANLVRRVQQARNGGQ